MPLCEVKLNQHLARNPELMKFFDRYKIYPHLQQYAHIQEN